MNKDFEDLLVRIRNDLQTKEVIKEKYDAILSAELLISSMAKKKRN